MLQIILGPMIPFEAGVRLLGEVPQQRERARVLPLVLVEDDEVVVLAVRQQRALRLVQPHVVEAQEGGDERVVRLSVQVLGVTTLLGLNPRFGLGLWWIISYLYCDSFLIVIKYQRFPRLRKVHLFYYIFINYSLLTIYTHFTCLGLTVGYVYSKSVNLCTECHSNPNNMIRLL